MTSTDFENYDPHEHGPLEEEPAALEPLEPESRKPEGPVSRRLYGTGSRRLDELVTDLIDALRNESQTDTPTLSDADSQIAREMVTTSLRLALQHATRAERKMINAAVKELAYSFRVFAPYRHLLKVSIFGSARVSAGDPAYVAARDFAALMAEQGWMVITGAGPGIMAAGHEGAGAEHSFGANIRLPFLNPANAYIANDGKLINFKYFFTRKVTFLKESDAFVLMPGGWGTLDEAFELLTLAQTGKSGIHPIVLLEPEGSTYWQSWLAFMHTEIIARGFILESDLSLFRIAETPQVAMDEILRFYGNYHSARFVGDRLVLRFQRVPDEAMLARLNQDFADLLQHGAIEVIEPTSQERRDHDALELKRVALYPLHAYGRLRQLIDAINEL